uniref:Uncharacterized protein n=1 Tax=Stegastes partitus TaxID=144197 RepID=A0A3B4Z5J8_9TELE
IGSSCTRNRKKAISKLKTNKLPGTDDDILVTIEGPDSSLPLLMKLFETYGKYSGYALNIQKTQIIELYNHTKTCSKVMFFLCFDMSKRGCGQKR